MNNNFVLKKLYDLCNINNFSTYRLSQESGVPLTTISSLYKNDSYPSIPTLVKLCSAFNITLSDFFTSVKSPEQITEDDLILLNYYHSLTPAQKKYLFTYIYGLISDTDLS